MEVILEFIFEVLVEVFAQFFLEIGIEFGFASIKEALNRKKEPNPISSIIGLVILGSLLGLISALVFPGRIITKTRISGIGVIISPLVTGYLLQLYGDWRRKRGKYTSYLATFWGGAFFAFTLALVRWYLPQC